MLSAEQNELITRVGPGTPCGALLRQYWQPVALAEELAGARPVRPVRLMGQDFVLFRAGDGALALLDRDCAHRGADLAFGRLEDGGLRCLFHGWLFAADGRCLETPAEPEGSRLHTKVRQRAYPVVERAGVVFAYLGHGEPPAFPALDCFVAPAPYVFAFKGLFECNWLQALEVGIDPAHASFLHRFFEDEDPADGYGRQFRAVSADSQWPMTRLMRELPRPEIRVEDDLHGLRLVALRRIDAATVHVRVTHQVFPQAFVIPLSAEMTITQWHVPVDDTRCYWYSVFTSFGKPVDREQMRAQRLATYTLPDYLPRFHRGNDYGFDPAEQRTRTYTGMGMDINVHDQWAVEGQGPIQDRTREHLGSTDRAIIRYRRLLREAIERCAAGAPLPMRPGPEDACRFRGPPTIDGIARGIDWRDYWAAADLARRRAAPWPAGLDADLPVALA
jgi:phthalate 4,5-dioxygenase oxygenase subunit